LPVQAATKQLCGPVPTDPIVAAPPPLGTPPPVACSDERYRCTGSKVVECAGARILAVCARGCSEEGAGLDDESVSDAAAVYLLCSR
jgi:hypothetical protein